MKTYPIRYCTGGCSKGQHDAHVYSVDPVDGKLFRDYLCPGNQRQAKEWLNEDGEGTLEGFIDSEIVQK
jgi:hypothetical protein